MYAWSVLSASLLSAFVGAFVPHVLFDSDVVVVMWGDTLMCLFISVALHCTYIYMKYIYMIVYIGCNHPNEPYVYDRCMIVAYAYDRCICI